MTAQVFVHTNPHHSRIQTLYASAKRLGMGYCLIFQPQGGGKIFVLLASKSHAMTLPGSKGMLVHIVTRNRKKTKARLAKTDSFKH